MRCRFVLISSLFLAMVALSGCTIGYRYHNVDSQITNAAGANAQVVGSGHMVELGVVLDFRFFRLVAPFMGSTYDIDIRDDAGGHDHRAVTDEVRGFRLDVPVLSVWNGDDGFSPGYPGLMEHRQSVELWLSGTGHLTKPPQWYADVGVVYYHHDLVAVRAFGGWGGVPYDGQTARFGPGGADYNFWKASPTGFTGGVEVTLGAGEQALDFIKFFIGNQKAAEKNHMQ